MREPCGQNHVACPNDKWIVRAGLGNRYFFVAATMALAVNDNVPFILPSPLLGAGGLLETDFSHTGVTEPGFGLTQQARMLRCKMRQCQQPMKGYGKDGFGQGARVATFIASNRAAICDMTAAPNSLGLEHAPRFGDIVVHFRSEGTGSLGLAGLAFIRAAIVDAKTRLGGQRVVVVVPNACLAEHPNVYYLVNEFQAVVRLIAYPTGSNGALKDLQFLAMSRILIMAVSTYSFWAAVTSENAHAIYYPIPEKFVTFNPWCDIIPAFKDRVDVVRFLDSRTGEHLTIDSAIEKCEEYKTHQRTSNYSSYRAAGSKANTMGSYEYLGICLKNKLHFYEMVKEKGFRLQSVISQL
jgi:hypothetical protein